MDAAERGAEQLEHDLYAGALLTSGAVGASELVGSIGYGRIIRDVRVGIVVKAIEQRVGGGRNATWAVDVGAAKEVLDITWGLSVQNLGPDLEIGLANRPLPFRVTFGASSDSYVVGPLDLIATAAVSRRRDGDVIPAAGVEVAWWPVRGRTFIGRLGVRRVPGDGASPVTLGAAFRGDDITVEYTFEGFDGEGSAHRVGLRWR